MGQPNVGRREDPADRPTQDSALLIKMSCVEEHGAHQLIRVEAALNQGLGFSFAHQVDRFRSGVLAKLGIDYLELADVQAIVLGHFADAFFRSDQDRLDQL